MSRSPVTLRTAEIDDAPVLVNLWSAALRRADPRELLADVELVIKAAAESAEQRLVIAEYDGDVAGAVLLRVSTVSPLNLEPVVQAISPHVLAEHRRHGVGRALMDSAVAFADEIGVGHLAAGADAGSRDANRFLARLALGPHATLRIAPTAAVRARLTAQRPSVPAAGDRRLSKVLATRRSLRRVHPDSSRATGE